MSIDYCTCRWASPSSHHDSCINDGCFKRIKTSSERLGELEQKHRIAIEALIEIANQEDYPSSETARDVLSKLEIQF